MDRLDMEKQLREYVRLLERKMGILNENEMTCCNITLAQCHAIVEIGRAGTISLIDLAAMLNLDNSTMSRTVNNLVTRGYARRDPDPKDRRYVTISLTESGYREFQDIETKMDRQFAIVYLRIPEEKRKQVVESLHLLNEAMKECNY